MKDIPLFTTEFGIASLTLNEIPYSRKAYFRIQDSAQPEQFVEECRDFCRAVGAEEIYATGHEYGDDNYCDNCGEICFDKLLIKRIKDLNPKCRIYFGVREEAVVNDNTEEDVDYPVVYFKSDTTGEKDFEEFYVPGEKLNMERFSALGVIEDTVRRPMNEVDSFFSELEGIFQKEEFTKAEIVEALKKFLPNFEHEEKGKNLDQKM